MYVICFYVPLDQAQSVKNAMFDAGAGRIGAYNACSWETKGEGQFRPLAGSKPFMGQLHKIEKVEELKVEMVCNNYDIQKVIAALHKAHPYETPAYHILKCEDISWDLQR